MGVSGFVFYLALGAKMTYDLKTYQFLDINFHPSDAIYALTVFSYMSSVAFLVDLVLVHFYAGTRW